MKAFNTTLSTIRAAALVSAVVLMSAGCTDLSEQVYSEIPMENFFKTEKQLTANAARAYTKLQAYCTEQSLWTLDLQVGDEMCIPVNANGSWTEERYGQLQVHNFLPSNKLIYKGWTFCFDGIAACNEVLYETSVSKIDFDGKDKIIAEIKVLRAFYYFMAVDGWGNVPFSIDYTDTSYPEQKDRSFMYTWIESEIKDNIDLLDDAPTTLNYGRITKGAAYTLLAKLYLNAQEWIGTPKWAEAEAACKKVMDSGYYSIEDNYSDNFKVNNENSKENIFNIVYSTVYTQSDHNAFIIYIMALDQYMAKKFNIPTSPWDGVECEPDFFQSYDSADTRRADTFLYGQQYDGDGKIMEGVVYNPIFSESLYGTGRGTFDGAKIWKWRYQTDGLLRSDQVSMDNDFAIFRYADVVLMYVESLMRQERTDEAVQNAEFQKIRTRAGLQPYTASQLTLDELLAERGRELAWEGWRRQDLIRFGKFEDKWWAKPATQTKDKLFPIPNQVMNANPNLKQNPY